MAFCNEFHISKRSRYHWSMSRAELLLLLNAKLQHLPEAEVDDVNENQIGLLC